MGYPPVAVKLWNGQEVGPPPGPGAVGSVCVRDQRALLRLTLDPLLQFPQLYAAGRLDVHGDLANILTAVARSLQGGSSSFVLADAFLRWLRRPRGNTHRVSRENVHRHYDIGNDFYRLWLDRQLVYTCAYFAQPSLTLEEAQQAKFEHVCRKLRLRAGQRVLEAGCGWGALALHMARHHGVMVDAYNISHEQVLHARRRVQEEGMQGRVRFIEDDWRSIKGRYDVFVSVGMLEHVGPSQYRRLGRLINRCLEQGGIGLIHSIGRNWPRPIDPWIERRIFPGAYAPTLRQMMDLFEPYDFSILDVENLRLHYALTLRHWLDRFEQSADAVREMFDELFLRTWRLYLAGSLAGFEAGDLQLFQIVFARGQDNAIPWTRDHVYADRSQTVV